MSQAFIVLNGHKDIWTPWGMVWIKPLNRLDPAQHLVTLKEQAHPAPPSTNSRPWFPLLFPLSFYPSPGGERLVWHIFIILIRRYYLLTFSWLSTFLFHINKNYFILAPNACSKGVVFGTIKAFLSRLSHIWNGCGMWCGMLRDVVRHTSRNES